MNITLSEMLNGLFFGGLLLGVAVLVVVYVLFMLWVAFRFVNVSKSYIFTKRFGTGVNRDRHKLRDHLIEHGMSLEESAKCMNSWK